MTSKIESVVAALARSVVYHGAAQPEDAQLVSEWLRGQNDTEDTDGSDDTTGKTFKPSGKK